MRHPESNGNEQNGHPDPLIGVDLHNAPCITWRDLMEEPDVIARMGMTAGLKRNSAGELLPSKRKGVRTEIEEMIRSARTTRLQQRGRVEEDALSRAEALRENGDLS